MLWVLGSLIDHTAYHHVDDVVLGTFFGNQSADIIVTHNRYPVCDDLDLIHQWEMLDDSQVSASQVTDDLEKLFDLGLCQCCRRFIKI